MSRGLEGALERVWYGTDRGPGARVAAGLLVPAGWAYGLGARLDALRHARRPPERLDVPVVSVGNLAVGGAGKTPVVLELVRRLAAVGLRPAVLSRGYGARRSDLRVVGDGSGALLVAAEGGDEPVMIARRTPGTLVLAGPDRAALGRRAEALGATVALLDDGLQHRRLARDLEIVVLDASVGLGNGRRLPAGPLREGPEALARADLVWITRADEPPRGPGGAPERLEALLAEAGRPVIRSVYRPVAVTEAAGGGAEEPDRLADRPVVALAGVARPASFLHTLDRLGARIVARRLFPDHHPFTPAELEEARAVARRHGAEVVTTEKDAARLPPGLEGVRVLRVDAVVVEGEQALAEALARLPRRAHQAPRRGPQGR